MGKEGLSVVEALSIVDRVVSKIRFVLFERTIPSIVRIDLLRLRVDAERVHRFVNASETKTEMFLQCITDLVAPFGEAEHILDGLLDAVAQGSGISNLLKEEVRRLCGSRSNKNEETRLSSLAKEQADQNLSRYHTDTIAMCLVSFEDSIRYLNTEASMASKSLLDVSVEDVEEENKEEIKTNTMMYAAAVCDFVKESQTIERVKTIRRIVSRCARAAHNDDDDDDDDVVNLTKMFDFATRLLRLGEKACEGINDWKSVLNCLKLESDPLILSLSEMSKRWSENVVGSIEENSKEENVEDQNPLAHLGTMMVLEDSSMKNENSPWQRYVGSVRFTLICVCVCVPSTDFSSHPQQHTKIHPTYRYEQNF